MTAAKTVAQRLIDFSSEISSMCDGGTTNDDVIELLATLDAAVRSTSFKVRKIAKREQLTLGWCDQTSHGYGGSDGEEYPEGTTAECSHCLKARADAGNRWKSVVGKLVPLAVAESRWREGQWKESVYDTTGQSPSGFVKGPDGRNVTLGTIVTTMCEALSDLCGFGIAHDGPSARVVVSEEAWRKIQELQEDPPLPVDVKRRQKGARA